jgi:hypothetical protein
MSCCLESFNLGNELIALAIEFVLLIAPMFGRPLTHSTKYSIVGISFLRARSL